MDSLYWIIIWIHDAGRRTWDLINDCMEEQKRQLDEQQETELCDRCGRRRLKSSREK